VARHSTPDSLAADSQAVAISAEADQPLAMAAVEALDRVVQALLWVDPIDVRERIVDAVWPALLLKRIQDGLLVARRNLELLDLPSAEPKRAAHGVPMWRAGVEGFRHGHARTVSMYRS
jgi:hypothetical protein